MTFDVDVKACARCTSRLEVRAVVTDRGIARKIRRCHSDHGSRSAGRRHDPRLRAGVRVTDREPRASYVLRLTCGLRFGRSPPARPPSAAHVPPLKAPKRYCSLRPSGCASITRLAPGVTGPVSGVDVASLNQPQVTAAFGLQWSLDFLTKDARLLARASGWELGAPGG
jgi:hypothetical protein